MAFVPTGSFAQSASTPPSCVPGSEFYDPARCAADRLRAGTAPSLVGRSSTVTPSTPIEQQVRLVAGGEPTTGGGGTSTGSQGQGGGAGASQDVSPSAGGSSASGAGMGLALLGLGGLGLLLLFGSRDEEARRSAVREGVSQGRNFFLVGKREEEDERKRRGRR